MYGKNVVSSSRPFLKISMFLPPANEVWGKVIVSEACVKNSVGGGGIPACKACWNRSHGDPPGKETPRQGDPPAKETPLQAHTQGGGN